MQLWLFRFKLNNFTGCFLDIVNVKSDLLGLKQLHWWSHFIILAVFAFTWCFNWSVLNGRLKFFYFFFFLIYDFDEAFELGFEGCRLSFFFFLMGNKLDRVDVGWFIFSIELFMCEFFAIVFGEEGGLNFIGVFVVVLFE